MDSPTPNNDLRQLSAILYQGSVVVGAVTRFHKGMITACKAVKP